MTSSEHGVEPEAGLRAANVVASFADGAVAVVTGGSRGIGAAVVRRLVRSGVRVGIGYRAERAVAESVVSEIRQAGGDALAVQGDVSDPVGSRVLVDQTFNRFGRLDIAVSCAGIEHFAALEEISLEDVRRVFDVNVAGQLFLAQAAAARLSRGGRIVLMSSISGSLAVRHHAVYGASKAAVSALARNLAVELGERGITINAVAPGGTLTDMAAENAQHYTHPALSDVPAENVLRSMTSAARWAEPEEVAAVVAFLVSTDASYISGSTVAVNGGWIG